MTETSTRGPRVTTDEVRDLNRLRRPTDDRMIAGVASGVARHLDIDPTIVRVLFGAATLFGGAGLILYGIAWLTVPEDGSHDSAASDLLRRNPSTVMVAGLILAGVIAGTMMLGSLVVTAPNPWPVLVVGALTVLAIVLFSRRQEPVHRSPDTGPLPPPPPPPLPPSPYPDATPHPGGGASQTWSHDEPADDSTEAATDGGVAPSSTSTQTLGAPMTAAPPPTAAGPDGPDRPSSPVPTRPLPPPPRPRRPRSRLVPATLCLVLIAMAIVWLADVAGGVDVHPSLYPGTALGIIATGLLVGAWYDRGRWLIFFAVVAGLATLATSVIGPGPYGESVFRPRSAADVRETYEHGTGEMVVHLEDVRDVANLDGRTIEITSHIGQLTVYVPSSLDASIDAEVTTAGDIRGLPDVQERGGGSVRASLTAPNDADPDVTLDVSLRLGQIEIIDVLCPEPTPGTTTPPTDTSDTSGVSDVPAACG